MLDDLELPPLTGLTDDAVAGRATHWSEPLTLPRRQPEAVPR